MHESPYIVETRSAAITYPVNFACDTHIIYNIMVMYMHQSVQGLHKLSIDDAYYHVFYAY